MPEDGPTEVSLDSLGVDSIDELLSLPSADIARRLGSAAFPPSEKLIGAVVLKTVDDLRGATADVAKSSRRIDEGTKSLIVLARYTLAIAIVALVVSLIALGKSL